MTAVPCKEGQRGYGWHRIEDGYVYQQFVFEHSATAVFHGEVISRTQTPLVPIAVIYTNGEWVEYDDSEEQAQLAAAPRDWWV